MVHLSCLPLGPWPSSRWNLPRGNEVGAGAGWPVSRRGGRRDLCGWRTFWEPLRQLKQKTKAGRFETCQKKTKTRRVARCWGLARAVPRAPIAPRNCRFSARLPGGSKRPKKSSPGKVSRDFSAKVNGYFRLFFRRKNVRIFSLKKR